MSRPVHPSNGSRAEVPSPGALRRRTVLAVGAALSLPFGTARAQAFPSKPIMLIVPWPPMDPAVVKSLHDAFRKAMDEPRHVELLDQLNQDAWYRSGDDYAKWARDTFAKDKALIERLGLTAKT
jgi:tripartite-type tricarboxylate transporter receptor subunit TctC